MSALGLLEMIYIVFPCRVTDVDMCLSIQECACGMGMDTNGNRNYFFKCTDNLSLRWFN